MEEKKEKTKRTHKRSPNFPVIDLPEAIKKAQTLYNIDKRAGSPRKSAFEHWGYGGEHGVSLGVLSAVKKYGLISEENNRILLTKDAEFILLTSDENKKLEIIQKCALKPDLFSQLWKEYSEKGLPSDQSLRDILIFDYKFNEKSVDLFINNFKQTLEYAKLKPGEDIQKDNNNENQGMLENPNVIDKNKRTNGVQITPTFQDYTIPQKGNRLAILRLNNPVTNEDIESILRWLELFKPMIVNSKDEAK